MCMSTYGLYTRVHVHMSGPGHICTLPEAILFLPQAHIYRHSFVPSHIWAPWGRCWWCQLRVSIIWQQLGKAHSRLVGKGIMVWRLGGSFLLSVKMHVMWETSHLSLDEDTRQWRSLSLFHGPLIHPFTCRIEPLSQGPWTRTFDETDMSSNNDIEWMTYKRFNPNPRYEPSTGGHDEPRLEEGISIEIKQVSRSLESDHVLILNPTRIGSKVTRKRDSPLLGIVWMKPRPKTRVKSNLHMTWNQKS
jgi:hypothetical protein